MDIESDAQSTPIYDHHDLVSSFLDLPVEVDGLRLRVMLREEKVVDCMASEGFEYTPFPAVLGSEETAIGGIVPNSELWLLTYGTGHTTTLFPEGLLPDDLVGYPGADFGDSPEVTDPNDIYLSSLSGREANAFVEALWGRYDADEVLVEPGCQQSVDDPLSSGLVSSAFELRERFAVEVAERMVASAEWSAAVSQMVDCVAEDGFPIVASGLEDLRRVPRQPLLLSDLAFESVAESLNWSLEDHRADGFQRLRRAQTYELDLGRSAVVCGWTGIVGTYAALSEIYQEELWKDYEAEALAIKEELDGVGWFE